MAELTVADWIVLAFIAVSVLIGLVRGLVVEVLSIVIWAVAVALAIQYGPWVGAWFERAVELPSARMALGYAAVFFGTTAVGALVLWLTRQLIASTGLTGTDRLFGAVFGLLRGVLVVVVVLLLAQLTPLPGDPWWKESRVLPGFIALGDHVVAALPAEFQAWLEEARTLLENIPVAPPEPVDAPPVVSP